MLHVLTRCTRLRWHPICTRGPRPRIVRQFASPLCSQTLSPDDFATKRLEWSRENQIVGWIGHLLKQEKTEDAVKLFQKSISRIPDENRTTRFALYERSITAFLDYKYFKDALELHREMYAKGLYASSGLRAKMLVCSGIVKAPHEQRGELESLFDELSHVLSLPSYSERSLCQLLDLMKNHPLIDAQFVSKLVDEYVNSRGSEYLMKSNTINRLILFYAHVGGIDTAENLVVSHQDSHSGPRPADAAPYTTLISELTNKSYLTSRRLDLLLDKMKQSQIKVDLPLLNVLVQAAVRNENLYQAFSLYETILKDAAPYMIPDSFVFGSLFNALQRIWTSRSPSLFRAHQPPNAPTPRQLFRQMLECHVLAIQAADPRTHPVVRISTLNVALRVFMLSMDYPGAFVVLQTFRALDLKPDVRSYRFVLTVLLAHLKLGLQAADESRSHSHLATWAVNFLGGAARALHMQPEDVRPEFASVLLEFAVGNTEYRAPSLALILGDEKAPPRLGKAGWDVEPLERLVAKAILATTTHRSANEEQAERALREKLAPYFYEMVPDRLWRGRRLRRATG